MFYHLSGWSLPAILLILLIFQLSFLRNTARHNKNIVVSRQRWVLYAPIRPLMSACVSRHHGVSWFSPFHSKNRQVNSRVQIKSKRVRIQLLHLCFSYTVSDAYWRPHLSGRAGSVEWHFKHLLSEDNRTVRFHIWGSREQRNDGHTMRPQRWWQNGQNYMSLYVLLLVCLRALPPCFHPSPNLAHVCSVVMGQIHLASKKLTLLETGQSILHVKPLLII